MKGDTAKDEFNERTEKKFILNIEILNNEIFQQSFVRENGISKKVEKFLVARRRGIEKVYFRRWMGRMALQPQDRPQFLELPNTTVLNIILVESQDFLTCIASLGLCFARDEFFKNWQL